MTEDKLPPEEQEDELGMDFAVEFTTNTEYLSAAFYAVSAVAELDPMTLPGKAMKNRILSRSFKIIDLCIGEMYDELFETEDNE